jgi:outer membrane protein
MRVLKTTIVTAAFGALLVPHAGFAQDAAQQPKPTAPPATQQPPKPTSPTTPATPPPATPAAAAKPPAPFPEGAKFAFIDLQFVATNSAEGKAATSKIEALRKKKTDELTEKNKTLQAAQTKLQQGGTVLSDSARNQLEKEIERLNRELQFANQDAQTEINELQGELQNEFQDKLNPVIEALRVEKGLHIIFSVRESGIIAADPGLDLSAEIVKRFDGAAKTAPKK